MLQPSTSGNRGGHHEFRPQLLTLSVVLITAVSISASLEAHADPARTYQNRYAAVGRCLNGTAYDGDLRAYAFETTTDNQDSLTVQPIADIEGQPEQLHFTVGRHIFRATQLESADNQTGGYLSRMGCPATSE